MTTLRERMRVHLESWRNDLPEASGWPEFFADCPDPAFDRIPEALELEEDAAVWPSHRGSQLPGAPNGAHLCRPFEGIMPADVRVVVLGQDPYPEIESATGRAFEDGMQDRAGRALRRALCALGQSALELSPGAERRAFCHGREGRAAAIQTCFNRLAREGVLFVNAAWTFSRKKNREDDHPSAHRALWKPVTEHLLRKIATRPDGGVVFLLFGGYAQRAYGRLNLPPRDIVRVIDATHPTASNNGYFSERNPFARVNDALLALGEDPIIWWALLGDAPE
jgi:uracil-DNA glycosylase